MIRMTGAAMAVMAAIMAAGCKVDVSAGAHDSTSGGARQQAPEPPSTRVVANVLIFGDASAAILNQLRLRLETLGHTVTIQPDSRLPATLEELSQYHTVWHVGLQAALTAPEQNLLIAYLATGGGVHLTGDTVGYDSMNDSLTPIVRATVEGATGVTLGRQGAVPGQFSSPYYAVNTTAAGGVSVTPNSVALIELVNSGGIGGLPLTSPNVLATGSFLGDKVVSAVWGANDMIAGVGALSVVMDREWLGKLNETDNDNAKLVENLQQHLAGSVAAPGNQPPVAVAELPGGQDLDCIDDGSVREQVPVELDASGSSDPDSGPSPLTYTWYEHGQPIGSGPNPTVNLAIGYHVILLMVHDGADGAFASVPVPISCQDDCIRDGELFTGCHPDCPCGHGQGDCDSAAGCLPGLVCLEDAGHAFGYDDGEVDVCSDQCPVLGVGAWNYCSPQCPCDVGEGDCDSNAECRPGLHCTRAIGPTYGFQHGLDVCEPEICEP
jgi:hypothetical protein